MGTLHIAALMGKPGDNPYKGLFEGFKPFDPITNMTHLLKPKAEWQKATDC